MCYAEKEICALLCNLQVSWISSLSISSPDNPPHWPRGAIWLHTGSQCLCLEMIASCQGCIIQILCFSKVTPPWRGAVATPNTPVHCCKTSESGIPLSSGCIDFSVISQISSFSFHIQWRSYWHTTSSCYPVSWRAASCFCSIICHVFCPQETLLLNNQCVLCVCLQLLVAKVWMISIGKAKIVFALQIWTQNS